MGAGSPKHVSCCHMLTPCVFGIIILERGHPQGVRSPCCPSMGSQDTPLLPIFPGGAQPVLPWLLQPHPGLICPGQCKVPIQPQCFHPVCSQEPCWARDQGLGSLSSLDAHAWVHKHKSAPNPAHPARASDPHCAGCPGQEDFPAYAMCLLRYPVPGC